LQERNLKKTEQIAAWLNRFVLLATTVIFTAIGLRFTVDPVHGAAESGISLGSALASTTARVSLGAFPLGFAIVTLVCLLSKRRLATGVRFVVAIMGSALTVRLLSILADGPVPQSLRLLAPEAILLTLSVASLSLESRRRRHLPKTA
jgi:hypothetical protein